MPGRGEVSDELKEKIYAYVEREAGRDLPLTTKDQAMVRWLLATDPMAQAVAQELRDAMTGVDALFSAGAYMPVPDDLATMIQTHGVLTAEGKVEEAANLLADFEKPSRVRPHRLPVTKF